MIASIQERRDAEMRLGLDASGGALIFVDFIGALAYDIGCETRDPKDVMNRLADLISPEAWELTVKDNERLIERCRDLECELADIKSHVASTRAGCIGFTGEGER